MSAIRIPPEPVAQHHQPRDIVGVHQGDIQAGINKSHSERDTYGTRAEDHVPDGFALRHLAAFRLIGFK